ncbi:MAG: hypothetical protein ABJQ29_02845 [Luteolibacter sp.]
MAYSVSKEALVPMLTRCIVRHGTLKAIGDYPDIVRERGEDATVTEEFIALNEIRKHNDSEEMIRAAFERAILAYTGALDKADKEIKELNNRPQDNAIQKPASPPFIPNLKYIVLWFAVIGIGAWMDEENFSATLAASVVIAGTGFLCFLAFLSRESHAAPK